MLMLVMVETRHSMPARLSPRVAGASTVPLSPPVLEEPGEQVEQAITAVRVVLALPALIEVVVAAGGLVGLKARAALAELRLEPPVGVLAAVVVVAVVAAARWAARALLRQAPTARTVAITLLGQVTASVGRASVAPAATAGAALAVTPM